MPCRCRIAWRLLPLPDSLGPPSLTSPPLTTIQQDIAGAGECLVEMVLAQIDGRDPPQPHLPTKLLVRGSTRAD